MQELELTKFFADLHVHTALSPCADSSCTPPNIVSAALERGLRIIAVTDHNSAENVEAMSRCGMRRGLTVIPGMELTTQEEVHVVCLLGGVESALELQDAIYKLLPDEQNSPDLFGPQTIVDEDGNAIGECGRLLLGAARISLEDAVRLVHGLNGLAIAAHVDRPSYSVIANLGMVPEDAELDALEISAALTREPAISKFPGIERFPIVTGSDAHSPDRIGEAPTLFLLKSAELGEMRMALRGECGREYLIQ
ncbi:MAG: PHP domain-containing protein [bacterium]